MLNLQHQMHRLIIARTMRGARFFREVKQLLTPALFADVHR